MSVMCPATVAGPMDLADQARAIRRHWAVVAGVVLVGLAFAPPFALGPSTIPGWMLGGGALAFFGGALALVIERVRSQAGGMARLRKAAEWTATAILMVALWFVIKAFLFQSFYIP